MVIDEVITMWEQDCIIEEKDLGRSSTDTAKLHAKYLRLLSDAKLRKAKLHADLSSMRKLKFRYYRGELTKAELTTLGWDQWQYSKPLKAEMDEFLKGDEDIAKIQTRLSYIENMVEVLESIMTQIKARDWQIKNAISWRQFMAGV